MGCPAQSSILNSLAIAAEATGDSRLARGLRDELLTDYETSAEALMEEALRRDMKKGRRRNIVVFSLVNALLALPPIFLYAKGKR